VTKKTAADLLRDARIAFAKKRSTNVLLDRVVPAREDALAAGLSIEDITKIEHAADVSVLGEERVRAELTHDLLQARYVELVEEIVKRRIRSRPEIRPLLGRAERAGGRWNQFGGRLFLGAVDLDNDRFREVVRGLEQALGWPHKSE
jgi:hypothetical protein